jgi:tRNA threonylcarbamoyl adenosine modification protein (Sua5/YciO/YrdC/YwlC family)
VPDDEVARELLRRTGPMAVSSANRSGRPAATTAEEAVAQLGESVAVVLDDGPRTGGQASTIVDCTAPTPRVLRVGAVPVDRLREVLPELVD